MPLDGKSDQNKPTSSINDKLDSAAAPPERLYRVKLYAPIGIVSSQCAYSFSSDKTLERRATFNPNRVVLIEQTWHHYEQLHDYKSAQHHGYQKSELLLCKLQMQKPRSSLSQPEMS